MFFLDCYNVALLGGARACGAGVSSYNYGLREGAVSCASGLCIAVSRPCCTVELSQGRDSISDCCFVENVFSAGSFFRFHKACARSVGAPETWGEEMKGKGVASGGVRHGLRAFWGG